MPARLLVTRLKTYRRKTYRPGQVRSVRGAIAFVNQRGFVFFWPIQGVELPSLWVAAAGDRSVGAEHDDPGHVTWRWKDSLLGEHQWYYAKLLRKRATLVSLEVAPYFYALTENYGAPEEDYLIQYEEGRMTQEAKRIYEAVLNEGSMDTVALRRKVGLSSTEGKARFDRALLELQEDMKLLPVGVAEAGAWNYAFIYDIVARHLPELPERARQITEPEARSKLLELYLRSVGAAPAAMPGKLFGWRKGDLQRAIEDGVSAGALRRDLTGASGEWIALAELQ
ncbi:MAG: crosslink repair DNA glycosylase YcaQ family protein [Chloroflexota bacterium]